MLEGPGELIDWGVVHATREKDTRCLARTNELIVHYQPTVVVTDDPDQSPHRHARIRKLLRKIHQLADKAGIKWSGLSRNQVRRTFRSSVVRITKYRIAQGIAERFPDLASRLPPPRKPWMSEDARMAIFDAVVLALTLLD